MIDPLSPNNSNDENSAFVPDESFLTLKQLLPTENAIQCWMDQVNWRVTNLCS